MSVRLGIEPIKVFRGQNVLITRVWNCWNIARRRILHRTASYQRTPILRQYCSLPKILRCWLTFDKELRFRLILQGHKRNVRTVRVWSSRDRGKR